MIVKVQIEISRHAPGLPGPQMLVYDKTGEIEFEGLAPPAVLDLMGGRPKVFFTAEVIENKIELQDEAPWQEW